MIGLRKDTPLSFCFAPTPELLTTQRFLLLLLLGGSCVAYFLARDCFWGLSSRDKVWET
jgi:hypothetical protein